MAPTTTPPPSDAHDSNRGTITLAVVLTLLALALLAGILAFTWRMRHRAKQGLEGFHNLDAPATVVGPRHLASRITPFGTRDAHQPGRNMRVATRRPDGAWAFSTPETPLNPFAGTDEPEPAPAPRPKPGNKTALAKGASKAGGGYLDPDGVALPPPAYSPTDESPLKSLA